MSADTNIVLWLQTGSTNCEIVFPAMYGKTDRQSETLYVTQDRQVDRLKLLSVISPTCGEPEQQTAKIYAVRWTAKKGRPNEILDEAPDRQTELKLLKGDPTSQYRVRTLEGRVNSQEKLVVSRDWQNDTDKFLLPTKTLLFGVILEILRRFK